MIKCSKVQQQLLHKAMMWCWYTQATLWKTLHDMIRFNCLDFRIIAKLTFVEMILFSYKNSEGDCGFMMMVQFEPYTRSFHAQPLLSCSSLCVLLLKSTHGVKPGVLRIYCMLQSVLQWCNPRVEFLLCDLFGPFHCGQDPFNDHFLALKFANQPFSYVINLKAALILCNTE